MRNKDDNGLEINVGDTVEIRTMGSEMKCKVLSAEWYIDRGWHIGIRRADGSLVFWDQLRDGGTIKKDDVSTFQDPLKQGDILLYIGDEGEQIGVVKDVSLDGSARVGSGNFSTTVSSISFIEIIPATERTTRMAKYLNR